MENRFKVARTVHNQHGPQSTKEVEKETGVTKSLIEDIESTAGKPRNVGYLTVKKLAEHYGVSSDYLLGLSPTPTTDVDVQAACKFTGLSTKAVATLSKADSNERDFISFLIENCISSNVSSMACGCAFDKAQIKSIDKECGTAGIGKDNVRKMVRESDNVRKAYNEVKRLQDRVDMYLWRCHKILESAIEAFVDHILKETEKDGKC